MPEFHSPNPMIKLTIPRGWGNLPAPVAITPLEAIRQTLKAIELEEVVPAAAGSFIATAFRAYLDGLTKDLTRALGLRPRRGGAHETPLALERKQARDSEIKRLYEMQDGTQKKKLAKVLKLLNMPLDAPRCTDEELCAYALKVLHEPYGKLPTSTNQIRRIVMGETVAERRR